MIGELAPLLAIADYVHAVERQILAQRDVVDALAALEGKKHVVIVTLAEKAS